MFLIRLKLVQWAGELVIFAFLYALFRFLMVFLILNVSQGGSAGLILTTLFGMHCLAICSMRLEIFVVYVSRLSSRSEANLFQQLLIGEVGSRLDHSSIYVVCMIVLSVLKISQVQKPDNGIAKLDLGTGRLLR